MQILWRNKPDLIGNSLVMLWSNGETQRKGTNVTLGHLTSLKPWFSLLFWSAGREEKLQLVFQRCVQSSCCHASAMQWKVTPGVQVRQSCFRADGGNRGQDKKGTVRRMLDSSFFCSTLCRVRTQSRLLLESFFQKVGGLRLLRYSCGYELLGDKLALSNKISLTTLTSSASLLILLAR